MEKKKIKQTLFYFYKKDFSLSAVKGKQINILFNVIIRRYMLSTETFLIQESW